MSLGVNLLAALVKRVAKTLNDEYDVEIVEMHHNKKIDAPSGTALMLGRAAAEGRSTARDGLKQKLKGLKPGEITTKCIETLGQAGAVVDAKAPDDAAAFKAWLRQISQHVAEASREGGLFGAGSGPVSDKEKATLQQISSALKLAA